MFNGVFQVDNMEEMRKTLFLALLLSFVSLSPLVADSIENGPLDEVQERYFVIGGSLSAMDTISVCETCVYAPA